MKKFRGKALAALLSLALVASSFPVTLASASTKTITGSLKDDAFDDTIYLVNGGTGAQLTLPDFGSLMWNGTDDDDGAGPLTTDRHEEATDVRIASISHKSGDRLVKWYDSSKDNEGNIDDDTDISDVALALRNDSVEGEETLSILYKGTWTDDDTDTDYTVKATQTVTIHAYDKYQAVVGESKTAGTTSPLGVEGELDDTFAQKTLAHEINSTNPNDTRTLAALRAYPSTDSALAQWEALPTAVDGKADTSANSAYLYTLDSSSENVTLSNSGSVYGGYSAVTAQKPGISVDSATGEVTVAAPTGSTPPASYKYKVTHNGVAGTATAITAGTATAIPSIADGDTITVTGYADDGSTTVGTPASVVFTKAGTVTATVKDKANTGSLTLKAMATTAAKDKKIATNDADYSETASASDVGDSYLYSTKDVKEKTSVDKKILVQEAVAATTSFTKFTKYSGSSYLATTASLDKTTYNDAATAIKINGYDVKFKATTADNAPALTVTENASVGKVTGDVKSLTISEGTVSSIDVDDSDYGAGDVSIDEGKVSGDITTDGKVSVTSPKSVVTGAIDAGEADVTSGKTGDIKAATVVIEAQDDDSAVSVGNVKAKDLTLDSEDSKITIKKLTSKAAGSSVSLSGSDVTIDAIDFNNYDTDFKFDDFQGTIPAPANADVDGGNLTTTDENDKVTVKGAANISGLSIEDGSKVTFTDKLEVGDIDGSGTLVVGLGDLYVTGSAAGVTLKISDSFKAGDTVFTSVSDTVDEDDMDTYGFTLAKTEGSSKDTFKVKSVSFQGLTVSGQNEIAKDQSATFTASAYAPGTSIPSGYSIKYSLDGSDDVFAVTDNGNGTATVKVVGFDDSFASENKATLTAELVDANGDVDDDYDAGEIDIAAIKTPAINSDTTKDFTLAPGASYQFKITASTAPTMTAGSAGVLSSITNVGVSGNAYFIKVTAAANATGKETGIYVNGTKLLVIKVAGTPVTSFTSDTTSNVTVKKGSSYSYKITASTAPSFGIGSAGVFNYTLVSHSGNAYIYKITAVGAVGAQAGIYVNGTKVNVAKVG